MIGWREGRCLDDDTLAAYFDGGLDAGEAHRLFEHVDGCAACARMFAAIAAAHAPPGPTTGNLGSMPTVPAAHAAASPATLGRYRVDRILGVGGMGVVYAAHDPDLDRTVAIKLLRPSPRLSAEELRARLTREAQIMARLSHPNIIPVHEIGSAGDQVFVVMELIDGTTLAEWLAAEARSWPEIVRVFVAAGEGLAAAHAQGVVHRDFKPDNVLISRAGRICVTDFGVAHLDSSDVAAPHADGPAGHPGTLRELVVGTPAYMAPEQMRGEPTDARTDLFSFCVALYEALYEVRPYPGKTLEERRAAIARGRIAPPRRARGPALHRRVILRGLRARPGDRPPAMADLLAVLRIDPFARRKRRLVIAAAALMIVGSGLAVVQQRRRVAVCSGAEARLANVWDPVRKAQVHVALAAAGAESGWPRVEHKLDQTAAAWVSATTGACEAARLRNTESPELFDRRTRCLDDRLSELRAATELLASADHTVAAHALRLVDSVSDLGRCADTGNLLRSDVDPPRGADKAAYDELRDQLSRTVMLTVAARIDDVEAILPGIVERARRLGNFALIAEADERLGSLALERGRYDDAIAALHRSASAAERVRHDGVVARAWRNLALLALMQGRLEDGLIWADYADAAGARLKLPKAPQAGVASYRAAMLAQLGRYDEALAEAHRVLALTAETPDNVLEATALDGAHENAVIALAEIGHLDEAIDQERAMYVEAVRRSGVEHPFSILREVNLLGFLVLAHRYAEAQPLIEAVAQLVEHKIAILNDTGEAYAVLGAAEAGTGRLELAADHLDQALAVFAKASVTGASVVFALTQRAGVARALGRTGALALLERAVSAGEAARLSPLLMAPARLMLAELLPRSAHDRAVQLASNARDAFAAAARSGADRAPVDRDRAEAWLVAHTHP
jgi:eukaryotic-like serine/threonine-protein kinase